MFTTLPSGIGISVMDNVFYIYLEIGKTEGTWEQELIAMMLKCLSGQNIVVGFATEL